MKARSAMTRDVVCIAPANDLDAAWELMTRLRMRHLVVLDGNRLVGVLSDRDVLIRARQEEGTIMVPSIPVAHAMTPRPITCLPSASISHVAGLMLDNRIDCVPVVDSLGALVGLITSTDLLELLRDRDDVERKNVPFDFRLHHGMVEALPV
ncbi:MAG: CBS domain-containing protein [Myxococcota bacterium]